MEVDTRSKKVSFFFLEKKNVSNMEGLTFSMHVIYIKKKISIHFLGDHVNGFTLIYIYIYIFMPMMQPPLWLTSPPTLWLCPCWLGHAPTKLQIYIFRLKKKKYLQVWRGEDFSRWIEVRFLKLGWRTLKDQKSYLKKFKSSFSTIVPFI